MPGPHTYADTERKRDLPACTVRFYRRSSAQIVVAYNVPADEHMHERPHCIRLLVVSRHISLSSAFAVPIRQSDLTESKPFLD